MATKTEERPLDPVTEAALPPGPIPLLQRYEQISGTPLRKLQPNEAIELPETKGKWEWSWQPEQVAMFLSDWDSQIYMASPLLRDLAMTRDPMGGGFLYERFCRPQIIEAIRKVQIMYAKPLGRLAPVPKGTFSVDLSKHPPGVRPTAFHINDWTFVGRVENIPEKLRDELARKHSLWYQNRVDVMNPRDHDTVNLGEVRR